MKWNDEKAKEFAKLYVSGAGGKTIEEKLENFKKEDKKIILKKRREWHSWIKRAEKAGIAPLPPHRPSEENRKRWEDKIIKKEEEVKASHFGNPKIRFKDTYGVVQRLGEYRDNDIGAFFDVTKNLIKLFLSYFWYAEKNYPDIHKIIIKEIENGND